MASVKELLIREVERLSEEDARQGGAKLTREELIRRATDRPGIHVPDPDAPPFEDLEPTETRGIPASQMLIADRR